MSSGGDGGWAAPRPAPPGPLVADRPLDAGWWQADDGRWYAPSLEPAGVYLLTPQLRSTPSPERPEPSDAVESPVSPLEPLTTGSSTEIAAMGPEPWADRRRVVAGMVAAAVVAVSGLIGLVVTAPARPAPVEVDSKTEVRTTAVPGDPSAPDASVSVPSSDELTTTTVTPGP